jgi:hypothetical protein
MFFINILSNEVILFVYSFSLITVSLFISRFSHIIVPLLNNEIELLKLLFVSLTIISLKDIILFAYKSSPIRILLLTSKLADPKTQRNFYRYQVRMGDGPFITPGGGSLFDDRLFNGQNFSLNLPRPGADGESFNFTTFGLYPVGKETTIRWVTMDQSLFDFWNTLEFSINNQGPFSTYTRVKTNVSGALGVWGGLYVKNYTLIVKK